MASFPSIRDSSVSIATSYVLDVPGFESRQGKGTSAFQNLSRPTLSSIQSPLQWVPGICPGSRGRSVKLTAQLHLVSILRKSRALPLLHLYAFMARTGTGSPFYRFLLQYHNKVFWENQASCILHRTSYSYYCKMVYISASIYKVIRNDCQGFNNLSYTLHFR